MKFVRLGEAGSVRAWQLERGGRMAKILVARMGSVDEIASMAAWMCSGECSYSIGAVFDLSGGRATY